MKNDDTTEKKVFWLRIKPERKPEEPERPEKLTTT